MTAGIIGGFVVLIGIWLKALIEQNFVTKKEMKVSKYNATRIIVALDKFIHDCASVAYDEGNSNTVFDEYFNEWIQTPNTNEPIFPVFSPKIDWACINNKIHYDFFKLESMQRETISRMMGASEFQDYGPFRDGWFSERQNGYRDIADAALKLREDLEQMYELPERWVGGWDVVAELRAKKDN